MKQSRFNAHRVVYLFSRARAFKQFVVALTVVAAFASFSTAASKNAAPAKPLVVTQPDLESSNEIARLQALELHRTPKGKISEKTLRAKLKTEKNPRVRRKINQALADSDSPQVVVTLVDSLKNDSDASVREGAAQALTRYVANATVAQELASALQKDSAPGVRYACALALSLSDTPIAANALEIASKDADPLLRSQVAFALKRHTSRKAQQILRTLRGDKDARVRELAGGKSL